MESSDDPGFKDAIRFIGDRNRSLEGEDPDTDRLEDASHWRRVYSELLKFKETMIRNAKETMPKDVGAGDQEISVDFTIMAAERDRLESRLRFWEGRERELAGGG